MKIIVDVDGVLADLVKSALTWVNVMYATHFVRLDIREWHQPLAGTGTDIGKVIADLMQDDAFLLGLHAVSGAIHSIRALLPEHDITIATARPLSAAGATLQWLRRRGIHYDQFSSCVERSKVDLEGDVLIDDNVDNCREFAHRVGRYALLFDQPWNRYFVDYDLSRCIRGRGWGDMLGILRGMKGEQ